jgi:hypothetical protein
MKKLFTIALLAAFTAFLPTALLAADKPDEAPPAKTEKKARHIVFNGKVSAVDKAAKTVTLEGKEKVRVFQVTSETKIHKDKKPGTLDDVVVGDRVGGAYRENAEGKMELLTLNTGLPQAKQKAKDSKEAKP